MQKVKSQIFYANQGLPNDTQVYLDDGTQYMRDFIALIVGEPIQTRKRVSHTTASLNNQTHIVAHLRRVSP